MVSPITSKTKKKILSRSIWKENGVTHLVRQNCLFSVIENSSKVGFSKNSKSYRFLGCRYVTKKRNRRFFGFDDAIVVSGVSMVSSYLYNEFKGHSFNENTVEDLQKEVKGVQREIKSEGLLIDKLNRNFE